MATIHKVFNAAFTKGDAPRTYGVTLSTGSEDRTGERIRPAGWVIPPRVPLLWGHATRELPIGRARDILLVGDVLRGTIEFPPPGLYDFADQVHGLIEAGFLHSVSVGFRVLQAAREGWTYFRQELLELSVVNVPALPEATVDGRAIDDGAMRKWLSDEPGDVVRVVFDDEADGTDADPLITVRQSQLTATIRDSVAPLVAQARALTARLSAPEPDLLETDLSSEELDEIIVDALRHELSAVVRREVKAAVNALRGRVD